MILHVLCTENGIPGWIGETPREGSERVEGLSIDFLAAHRRTDRGKWVARGPVKPAAPTQEAEAEAAEAEYQAALQQRSDAVREALSIEADPQFFRWQRGEVSREDWLESVARVKARFPRPERS
ncbi:MAG: hypothetical protein ACK4GM_05735 [Tabrizicola sp.]